MVGIIQLNPAPPLLSGKEFWLSEAYKLTAIPHCLQLLAQRVFTALDLARDKAGKSMPARIAMMAMTTSNSIRVKARVQRKRWLFMAWGDGLWGYCLFLTFRAVRASEIFGTVKMVPRGKGSRSEETSGDPWPPLSRPATADWAARIGWGRWEKRGV